MRDLASVILAVTAPGVDRRCLWSRVHTSLLLLMASARLRIATSRRRLLARFSLTWRMLFTLAICWRIVLCLGSTGLSWRIMNVDMLILPSRLKLKLLLGDDPEEVPFFVCVDRHHELLDRSEIP